MVCLLVFRKFKAVDNIFKGMRNNILLCLVSWSGYFIFKFKRHSFASKENGSGMTYITAGVKLLACSLQLLRSSSWNWLPTDYFIWIVIVGSKRSPRPNLDLVSSTLLTVQRDLSQSIHILGVAMFFRLICVVCGRKGPGVEFKVRMMSR